MSFTSTFFRSFLPSIFALLPMLLLLSGCVDHDANQSALDPKGPVSKMQYEAFMVTFWVTMFLFLTVGGALAIAVWKFRMRPGDENKPLPKQSHGSALIEVGLILFSAAMLVIIAVPTLKGIVYMHKLPPEYQEDAITVNVTGWQWWWEFEYADEEGLLTANELVFPAGRAVKLNLVTGDVNHSFWLPKLAGKTDLIAGQTNTMWIKADNPGEYWGQCAEFCGDSHAYMLFRGRAVTETEYEAWLAEQKRVPETVEASNVATVLEDKSPQEIRKIAHGKALYNQHCATCHRVNPTARGNQAPNLTHIASRETIAAGWLENTPENLHRWIKNSESVKPGNLMYQGVGYGAMRMAGMKDPENARMLASDANVDAIVAYLMTLK